jgi:hypothetical protein
LGCGRDDNLCGHILGAAAGVAGRQHRFRGEQAVRRGGNGGPFYLEADQLVELAGAELMFHCRGESRGFFKLAGPLIVWLANTQVQTAAGHLKDLLEQNAL